MLQVSSGRQQAWPLTRTEAAIPSTLTGWGTECGWTKVSIVLSMPSPLGLTWSWPRSDSGTGERVSQGKSDSETLEYCIVRIYDDMTVKCLPPLLNVLSEASSVPRASSVGNVSAMAFPAASSSGRLRVGGREGVERQLPLGWVNVSSSAAAPPYPGVSWPPTEFGVSNWSNSTEMSSTAKRALSRASVSVWMRSSEGLSPPPRLGR